MEGEGPVLNVIVKLLENVGLARANMPPLFNRLSDAPEVLFRQGLAEQVQEGSFAAANIAFKGKECCRAHLIINLAQINSYLFIVA